VFCVNKGEKTTKPLWFVMPESVSRFAINYRYTLYLVVDWNGSARFGLDETAETLIEKTGVDAGGAGVYRKA